MNIEQIISKYKNDKLEDFLISEIDENIIQETIDFVKSSDSIKKRNIKIYFTMEKVIKNRILKEINT